MENFDTLVIGSGPGGYVTAIKSSQLGYKTAIVEKYPNLGGTCLNVGCIPSKSLLDLSEKYYEARNKFSTHGIEFSNIDLNWTKMQAYKNKVIADTSGGVNYLMKKNKVQVFTGEASFVDQKKVKVIGAQQSVELAASNIVIATGAKPTSLPGISFDSKFVISSTEALSLDKVPKSLVIIGGGVIGLEFGSVYARLGTKVTVIEFFDKLLTNFDEAISKEALSMLEKIGIEFYLGHQMLSADIKKNQVLVKALDKDKKEKVFEADHCLIAVGRKANTTGLSLDKAGVATDNKGFIKVNSDLETSSKGVYAIGDVIGGYMLAHKASEEGVYVMERINGQKPKLDYSLIPGVVYTWPEIAAIGLTEEQCKEQKLNYKKGSFPFKALGRARASDDTSGFVKLLADKGTDELLGAHIVGARASDLIMEVALAMQYKASAEDIARICHPHPTFNEAIKEAALSAWDNQPIHI